MNWVVEGSAYGTVLAQAISLSHYFFYIESIKKETPQSSGCCVF